MIAADAGSPHWGGPVFLCRLFLMLRVNSARTSDL